MVKLYADTANLDEMLRMSKDARIRGFTTNPTLMRKAGVINYAAWGRQVCLKFPGYPVSFEVISDDFDVMQWQAKQISSWSENVYVKIPVTNTKGESSTLLVRYLSSIGIKLNVTAVMTGEQFYRVCEALTETPAIISIFAGRIADTGRYPAPLLRAAVRDRKYPQHEILWASPRQVLDVYEAEACGCDIVTITPEILKKLDLKDLCLEDYSMQTVKMFYDDAVASAFTL